MLWILIGFGVVWYNLVFRCSLLLFESKFSNLSLYRGGRMGPALSAWGLAGHLWRNCGAENEEGWTSCKLARHFCNCNCCPLWLPGRLCQEISSLGVDIVKFLQDLGHDGGTQLTDFMANPSWQPMETWFSDLNRWKYKIDQAVWFTGTAFCMKWRMKIWQVLKMPHVDWILNSGSKQVSKGRGLHGGGAKSNKLHQQDFYEGFSLSMKHISVWSS